MPLPPGLPPGFEPLPDDFKPVEAAPSAAAPPLPPGFQPLPADFAPVEEPAQPPITPTEYNRVPGAEYLGGKLPGTPKPPEVVKPITAGAQIRAEWAKQPGGVAGVEERLAAGGQRFGSSQVTGFPGQPTAGEVLMTAIPPLAEAAGGAAIGAQSANARQAFAALDAALSAYFTYGAGKGVVESLAGAKQAFDQGDYLGMVRQLGTAGVEGAFGWMAGSQAAKRYQEVADIAKMRRILQDRLNAQAAAEKMQQQGPPRVTETTEVGRPSSTELVPAKPGAAPVETAVPPSPVVPQTSAPAAGESAIPALPPGFRPVESPAPAITKGATFETRSGTYRVRGAGDKRIIFEKQTPSGWVSGIMPRAEFEKLVVPSLAPTPAEEPAVSPAVPEAQQQPVSEAPGTTAVPPETTPAPVVGTAGKEPETPQPLVEAGAPALPPGFEPVEEPAAAAPPPAPTPVMSPAAAAPLPGGSGPESSRAADWIRSRNAAGEMVGVRELQQQFGISPEAAEAVLSSVGDQNPAAVTSAAPSIKVDTAATTPAPAAPSAPPQELLPPTGAPAPAAAPERATVAAAPSTESPVSSQKKPTDSYDYASTQVNLPSPISKRFREFASHIPDSKLAEKGREDQPHITIKYGLESEDPEPVRQLLAGEPPIKVKLGKASLFENDDADVLKVDVTSSDLDRLNKKIAEALANTETHPGAYKPHATIAYLRPGEGKKYAGKSVPGISGQEVTLDRVMFSTKNGEQVEIRLGGENLQKAGESAQNLEPPSLGETAAQPETTAAPARGTPQKVEQTPQPQVDRAAAAEVPAESEAAGAPPVAAAPAGLAPAPITTPAPASASETVGAASQTELPPSSASESTSPQLALTGSTYVYRNLLKKLGARWNAEAKAWIIDADKADQVRKLSKKIVMAPYQPAAAAPIPPATKPAPAPPEVAAQERPPVAIEPDQQLAELRRMSSDEFASVMAKPGRFNPDLVREVAVDRGLTSPAPKSGAESLIDAIYDKLKAGESLGNVNELNKLVEQHFGASRTSGQWTPKDAFDAMETGINRLLIERGAALMEMDAIAGLKELRALMERITSQGVRTDEQIEKQQFSTPPTESYTVAKVASITPDDVILEPSAGNGGLAVWPKAIGATVHVNEISDRRARMLEAIGFGKPTAHDGEIINALLDPAIKPTVILMNPPFSAGTVKSNAAKNRNLYGFNHVDSALQRLGPGGRLVAILGGGRANDPNGGASLVGGDSERWFSRLARQYNIRANVRISGREYQKYGTAFATRIIVIDKDGPTPSQTTNGAVKTWKSVVQGNVETLEEAYNLLRNVAESKPEAKVPARPARAEGAGEREPRAGLGAGAGAGAAGDSGVLRGQPGTRPADELAHGPAQPGGSPRDNGPGAGSEQPALQQPGSGLAEYPGAPPAGSSEGGAANTAEQRPLEQPEGVAPPDLTKPLTGTETTDGELALARNTDATEAQQEDSAAYISYRPTLKGPAHPGDIVETKTMATVPMPEITYKPKLPASVLEGSRLSAVQLEAVSIAGQQNNILLPGGFRASALIGDGTGVGKGRISAGILWDNYRQGRKRLVWVSEKWDLMQDAIRDLKGIGATELLRGITEQEGKFVAGADSAVKPFKKYGATVPIQHDGVLFTTYALIRSEDKKGNRRVAQLEQYLRGDDDGEGAYILFDESHNLKNAVAAQGSQVSQIGQKVKELLERMPKLRTVSLSATAATDVVNLGYLDRLGLWGPGTPFPNGFGEFQTQIAPGGMAAMEMIARELKAQGKYVSRTLSFKGVTYSEAEHVLTDEQKELYRTAAGAWATVLQNAQATIQNTTNGGGRQAGRFMSQFYGAQQRFFNLLISTLKIPTAVESANKALADGKSVVITLVNTNEAAQNREKNKARDLDDSDDPLDYDFGPKEMLVEMVRQHYPVQQYRDDVDSAGNPIKVPVYRRDKDGREIPVNNPEAEAARDALIEQINRDLHMPENPLDVLVQSLGGEKKVAELTGRKERYDRALEKFVPRGDPHAKRDEINLFEMRAFQNGKKRVAVLSGAAGTGISLHAGKDVANKQQRYHITLQVGWSADKQMQMFGRTHRTNQVHPPEYVMLVSDLGGERRFVSTIARRLGSLGALTKGQKNATSGTDLMEKVNFETDQGRQATNSFYSGLLLDRPVPGTGLTGMQILHDLHVLKMQGGTLTVPPEDRMNVTRLLNRLLALDPDVQNGAYNYFYDIFQAAVQDAIDRGTLDTGVKRLPGDEFNVKESRAVSKDPKTGAETFYYPVDAKERTHRVSPDDLNQRLRDHQSDHPVILRNDKGKVVLAIDAQPIVHADGRLEAASYTATPAKGKWQKVPNTELGRMQPVADWAEQTLKKAKREAKDAQDSLEYYREDVERQTVSQRERLARQPKEGLSQAEEQLRSFERAAGKEWYGKPEDELRADVERARADVETAQKAELPENHWTRVSVAKAEKKLEAAQAALAEAETIATNPMKWAKAQWKEMYEAGPSHTTVERHLIGGAVMRWWNPIKEAAYVRNSIFTTADTKTGQRVVGIDIPDTAIGNLLNRITGGGSTVNAEQLEADILRNNLEYTLEGNIQVRRGRVGRENVIQLIPPNQEVARNLVRLGTVSERGVTPVYYVPNNYRGDPATYTSTILGRILGQYPVKPEEESTVERPPHPARQYVPDAEAARLIAEGAHQRSRLDPAAFDDSTPPGEILEHADSFYRAGRGGRPGVLYVNGQGRQLLEAADTVFISGQPGRIGGLTLEPNGIAAFAAALREIADGVERHTEFPPAAAEAVRRVAAELAKAATDSPVIVIPLDGRPLHAVKTSRRHEGLHRELSKLVDGTKVTGILQAPEEFLNSSDSARRAADTLRQGGYSDEDLADEIFVRIGSGEWEMLGLPFEEALDLFAGYLDRLQNQYRNAEAAVLKLVHARVRRAYNERREREDASTPRGPSSGSVQEPPGGGASPTREGLPEGRQGRLAEAIREAVSRTSSAAAGQPGTFDEQQRVEPPTGAFQRLKPLTAEKLRRALEIPARPEPDLQTKLGGRGFWVHKGKVSEVGFTHADRAAEIQGSMARAAFDQMLDAGAVRGRGENLQLRSHALDSDNFAIAVEEARQEAERRGRPITVQIDFPDRERLVQVPAAEAGEFAANPQRYLSGVGRFWREEAGESNVIPRLKELFAGDSDADRWRELAAEAENLSDEDLLKAFPGEFADALRTIERYPGMPADLFKVAKSLAKIKDAAGLRDYLSAMLPDAAELAPPPESRLAGLRGSSFDHLTFGLISHLFPDTSGPVAKKAIRQIRLLERKQDMPESRYREILKDLTGKKSTEDLTAKEAEALAEKLTALGVEQLGLSRFLNLVRIVHSPSWWLKRSAAGEQIYESAQDHWFEQEHLNDRLTKWWHKANEGLSKADINAIGLYRDTKQILDHYQDPEKVKRILKKAGENPDIVDRLEEFLSPELKAVSDRWSEIFEWTRKKGVEAGFLKPEQKIVTYLPFYYDEFFKRNPHKLKDAAVDLAQELGIKTVYAAQILKQANAKNVKFGSFDMERLGWLLPGMRDPNQRFEIYAKGFARKIAVTGFLKEANKLYKDANSNGRSMDPQIKELAHEYINQYAGRPASTRSPVDARVAGWLTGLQYTAKIGFNLWSPILNLTQTVVNTVPQYGLLRTAKAAAQLPGAYGAAAGGLAGGLLFGPVGTVAGMPIGIALGNQLYKLPPALNPLLRQMVALRKAGILDTFSAKFERPKFTGLTEAAQGAAAHLFDKSEQLNRAIAYLAGVDAAERAGASRADAVKAGRNAVRITQFFAGRLDAPLFARTPIGKILMQFKTFTFKELEFIRGLTPKQKIKFAAATVALGGFAALLILQAMKHFFPNSEVTKHMEQFQESANVAGFLHADRLVDQLGVFTVPGLEDLGGGQFGNRILRWAAGPSISSILDSIQGAAQFAAAKNKAEPPLKKQERAEKFLATLIRGWVPGGSEIMRVKRAVDEAKNPEEAVRILVNFVDQKKTGKGGSPFAPSPFAGSRGKKSAFATY